MLLGVALLTSCKKDEIENTATVDMAGEWYVTADIVDENGELVYGEDPYGIGSFIVATFNTAENVAEKMYVSDFGNFWEFQVPVTVDPQSMTFKTEGDVANLLYEGCNVTLTDGKITYGGAVTPSGVKADAIEFRVVFDDDSNGFIYRIHGFRYTGFAADE